VDGDYRARSGPGKHTFGTSQSGFELRIVEYANLNDFRKPGDSGRRIAALGTERDKRRQRFGTHIEGGDIETSRDDITRKRTALVPEAYEASPHLISNLPTLSAPPLPRP
jgi:hypothetical protein